MRTVTVSAVGGGIGNGGGGFVGAGTVSGRDIWHFLCTDRDDVISFAASYRAWATPLWNNTDMSKTRLANFSNVIKT